MSNLFFIDYPLPVIVTCLSIHITWKVQNESWTHIAYEIQLANNVVRSNEKEFFLYFHHYSEHRYAELQNEILNH